jgi:hypothetical protein
MAIERREALSRLQPGSLSDLPRSGYRTQPRVSTLGCYTKRRRPEGAKGSVPQSDEQQHLKSPDLPRFSNLNLTPLQGGPEGLCEPRVETLG